MTDQHEKQNSYPCIDYLHPEILSTEVILLVLKERKIHFNEDDELDKYKLLELFYDNILPLSQRVYGDGRRAKRLTNKRKLIEEHDKKSEGTRSGMYANSPNIDQSNPLNSKNGSSHNDRLKPPPDTGTSKVIQLNSSNCSNKVNLGCKRKNEEIPTVESPVKKRKHPPITW